jgi:hypothetical protein
MEGWKVGHYFNQPSSLPTVQIVTDFSNYSPPAPKPYNFAGIRGFGDKIK